jgi:CDP-glucose 4,6-dehydratase
MPRKFWQNRNVFVTGCTGLLGSWLTEELVRRGANVVGLVRDLVPKSRLNRSGVAGQMNTVRGEVEDYFLLERALNEYEIETVFHLAAQTIVGTANRNPVSTFETNIQGTWNLLEACRRNPLVKQVVVASSDKAYGAQPKLPYDESTPLEGRHPYDVSKSCVDLLAQSYYRTFGTPVCVTRCGNFYGGGDLNFNRIVPGTIRSVLFGESPVIRSDGTLVRDYFYIEDAVGAYLMLAEKMAELKIGGEAFNFSNEIQVTVLDLTKRILKLMKSGLKPTILNQAPNEIPHQYLSAKKARRKLGWKPLFTLEQGLKRTIAWYREFFREVPMSKSQ